MTQQPCRVFHHPGCYRHQQANQDAEREPPLQRIVLLCRLLHLSLSCSQMRLAVLRLSAMCTRRGCHECVLRVILDGHFGMSDVSCECGQTATCKWIFASSQEERQIHCVCGHQDCDQWRIFLPSVSTCRIGRQVCLACFVIVTHVCCSLPKTRTQMLHKGLYGKWVSP